jgi:putative transposase
VIAAHLGEYHVGLMCRALRVSYAGFWSWKKNPEGCREREERQLLAEIGDVFLESNRTYGSPRIYHELQKRGVPCSRERIARLMKKNDMQSRHYKRIRGVTRSDRRLAAAPNLLDQYFEADKPNSIWMADLTYIPTGEGWLYLAAVMDLCTRKIVGLSMKDTLETELPLEAFDRAVAIQNPGEDLIHHSDRGVQYTSLRYQQRLWARGMMCSMSRRGDCYDNAVIESFFHTLKVEHVKWEQYRTRAEAKEDLTWWIESWYNRRRLHSSLGYVAPIEYERSKKVA